MSLQIIYDEIQELQKTLKSLENDIKKLKERKGN